MLGLPFKPGDTLYIAVKEKKKVFFMETDYVKYSDTGELTVHGYVAGLCGNWATPKSYSLKYLNKRVIFCDKQLAKKWLKGEEL